MSKLIILSKPWTLAPGTCWYEVAETAKRIKLQAYGMPVRLKCWAIGDSTETKTIALIPTDDSTIEHARLIKAAPELYEALKEMLEHHGTDGHGCYDDGNGRTIKHDTCLRCVMAHKAVRIAEGRI